MKKTFLPGARKDGACIGCGEPPRYTVLLVAEEDEFLGTRYFLPNQHARMAGREKPAPLCHRCVREIEDRLRAALLYRQTESQRPDPPARERR